MSGVNIWEQEVIIPTYGWGEPDKNPMFLERRVYQGSSGVVYPYPVIDRVLDEKHDRVWRAVFLENRYLKIMVLPQLGGRVQMALDKTNDHHFIYYNRVIKPALVGLAGPWISGGIEFNWPQHHRPNTFGPVDWQIVPNADGSQTLWCSEVERMSGLKGTHGFTLHPDVAYLQVDVQLYNPTELPQTFLWWANPAVSVNDDYQSIFPPDVHAVMDHGKRDVSEFPIARGTYYKVNYAPGTDISRYKNIPVPTSYMVHHSDYDFVGCYDHGKQAGMMHVADHHVVPGKKQWTWGTSEFGRAWDRQLTDEDGPYIELMCGAFTDNQPDFSWLMPGEEKKFTQYFMPYKGIGGAKNASKDCILNVALADGRVKAGVYATKQRTVNITVWQSDPDGKSVSKPAVETRTISPEQPAEISVPLTPAEGGGTVKVTVSDVAGSFESLEFSVPIRPETGLSRPSDETRVEGDLPKPATPARRPAEIASNDELYLNGLHLEQYRHATYKPEDYYAEALRRDPNDARCTIAMGLLQYRRAKFAEAQAFFLRATQSITRRNPNPMEGEAFYYLDLARMRQDRHAKLGDGFHKATWNAATSAAALFQLARTSNVQHEKLAFCERALRSNFAHHQARHLKIALLRTSADHKNDPAKKQRAVAESKLALELDPMNLGAKWELHVLQGSAFEGAQPEALIALALDYAAAGLERDAQAVLDAIPHKTDALVHYQCAAMALSGSEASAKTEIDLAEACPPAGVNPQRLETVAALQHAMQVHPNAARAPYYLGNFWYAHQQYDDAIAMWERSAALDGSFPTVWRNLGLAYANKRNDLPRALDAYTRAFELDTTDARVLYELDQLRKKMNVPLAVRLAELQKHPALVELRDDLTTEAIALQNLLGDHDAALAAMSRRNFHPWEGGEGRITAQYVAALIGQARGHLSRGKPKEAMACLRRALVYPHNLGEGRLPNALDNNVHYWLGEACAADGETALAREHYTRATIGASEPTSATYYNDQPPDMIFYQGLAHARLGNADAARGTFERLLRYGEQHQHDVVTPDYFAVSLASFGVLDDDLTARNRIHCHYMMALGLLGLGRRAEAAAQFDTVLSWDASHQGAHTHKNL